MIQHNRTTALRNLEKIAAAKPEFRYRHICDYALGHKMSKDDRIWLYKKLKEKGIRILGMDPTVEQLPRRKKWHAEDGTEFIDYSHKDYEALYVEIVNTCAALKPLIEEVRRIKPPQRSEQEQIKRKLREGDASARERLIEMNLRKALALALYWSKMLDVDLQEAVGNAFEGLVRAANSYSPEQNGKFTVYSFYYIRNALTRGQQAHNTQGTLTKHGIEIYAKAYVLIKKWGCLECDRLIDCSIAKQKVREKCNCTDSESRMAVISTMDTLSLETYLEAAARGECEGQSEDNWAEVDDAAVYEEELLGYCVDVTEKAEEAAAVRQLQEKVQVQLNQLTPKEKEVLILRNGLGGGREQTLKEIGSRFGVSSEWIRQLECMALKKLRAKGTSLIKYLPDKELSLEENKEVQKPQGVGLQMKQVSTQKQQDDGLRAKQKSTQKQKAGRPRVKRAHARKPQEGGLDVRQDSTKKPQESGLNLKQDRPQVQSKWRRSMNLPTLLLRYRIWHNLNKKEMAKLCGITEDVLTYIEEPGSMFCPSSLVLLKIFENLDISEETFMDVVTHDLRFRDLDITWLWEIRNERILLKVFRQMNSRGKEIALVHLKALAQAKELAEFREF